MNNRTKHGKRTACRQRAICHERRAARLVRAPVARVPARAGNAARRRTPVPVGTAMPAAVARENAARSEGPQIRMKCC